MTAIGAVQWFKAVGVGSFAPYSSAPTKLSDNDNLKMDQGDLELCWSFGIKK